MDPASASSAAGHDLIAAIASASGPAERAVLRLSGAETPRLVQAILRPRGASQGEETPRRQTLRRQTLRLEGRSAHPAWCHDGVSEIPVTLLWMPGPRSFTAEDVAELHMPGHPELVQGVLARVLSAGARLAEPGEFTRRAFENGRIDLTQAEGVAALVSARSEAERRAATALLVGGLEKRIRSIRGELESVRALSEASLDFDESDTGHVPEEALLALMESAQARLREALGWERQRTVESGSATVALAGEPNAGKSTLFNRLVDDASRELAGPAIVSDLSGTTRDAKRGQWQPAEGVTVELIDTAGLGASAPTDTEADRLALESARRAVESADLILWLSDGEHAPAPPAFLSGVAPERLLRVRTKHDLGVDSHASAPTGRRHAVEASSPKAVVISALSGAGLEGLAAAVVSRLGLAGASSAFLARGLGVRHLAALEESLLRATLSMEALRSGVPLDLVAEDLRAATDSLDQISGRTAPEDLLDRIFAQFCLGK